MVIGDGMVAKAFKLYGKRKDICIFASGVSNSREIQESEFKREFDLLKKVIKENRNKTLVYFSTCSIEDKNAALTPYIKHKKEIEKYIITSGIQYYIFRVSQVVGITKNKTLVSNFKRMIQEREMIILWDKSTRNLIDIDDVYKIVDFLVTKKIYLNSTTNIASPFSISPLKIVLLLEKLLNQKARYKFINVGNPYTINISKIAKYFKLMNVVFPHNYTIQILRKYVK